MKDVVSIYTIVCVMSSIMCFLVGTFTYPVFGIPSNIVNRLLFIGYCLAYCIALALLAISGVLVYNNL